MLSEVAVLITKEFKLELRRQSVIAGIGLYLVSLTFISYISFSVQLNRINQATWSALFWLTILFSVVNSVAKSFIGEKKGLTLYYYVLASPQSVIIAKIIYNTILCFVLSLLGYGLFQIFLGYPVVDHLLFVSTLLLSSFGFSASLSLISGIASKTDNSNILMAVLSFPVVIGILLMSIRITKNVLDGLERTTSYDELLNLLAINCILGALAYVLFPYIWRS